MLSAAINRKVYVRQGDIAHHGNMYITLVGEQGGKKSTAKDFSRDIFVETYPDASIGAAMQSREEIVKYLSSDESTRVFKNSDGALVEYHPYAFFINELKNFLSFNPAGMIEFLTDIYDRRVFDARTLKRGLELILNPSLTILACETPVWLIDKLKANIISGGFSRRMLYIYEIEDPKTMMETAKPRPVVTESARAALDRVRKQLKVAGAIVGEFKWTAEGGKYFDSWYMDNKRRMIKTEDVLFRGYLRSKDVQLLKTCMLIAASYPEPKLVITPDLLEEGLAMLSSIEVNMPKLSAAAGRNELAIPQTKLLELLNQRGGKMSEKDLMWAIQADVRNPMEIVSILRFLKEAGQIAEEYEQIGTSNVKRKVILTKEYVILRASSKPQPTVAVPHGNAPPGPRPS